MVIIIVLLQIKHDLYLSHLDISSLSSSSFGYMLYFIRLLVLWQIGNQALFGAYIGIVKKRKGIAGFEEVNWLSSQIFHEVHG